MYEFHSQAYKQSACVVLLFVHVFSLIKDVLICTPL